MAMKAWNINTREGKLWVVLKLTRLEPISDKRIIYINDSSVNTKIDRQQNRPYL